MRARVARFSLVALLSAAELSGAALLLLHGDADGVFVARPAVVLPLLCGALTCTAGALRSPRARGWFGLLATALALALLLLGIAVTTSTGVALSASSALRPIIAGAMALIAAEVVLDRGRVAAHRILLAASTLSAVSILLFQPMNTSFGSWPALVPVDPALLAVLAPVGILLLQLVILAPLVVAVIGWIRMLRRGAGRDGPAAADAWFATIPVGIGGLSVLLALWGRDDAVLPATLLWGAVGAAAAGMAIAALLSAGARAVPVLGALSASALLLAGSTGASMAGGGEPGGAAIASAVTLAVLALGAFLVMRLRRGSATPVLAAPIDMPAEGANAATVPVGGPRDARLRDLSARETEVLGLLATGLTNREIAERVYLSPRTVDAHLRSIFRKLDVTGEGSPRMRAVAIWRGDG